MRTSIKPIYSIIGCCCLIFTILLVNLVIQDKIRWRQDLTEDKLYTLTDSSKEIISELDTSVEIRFYYSRFNNNMPAILKNYARRVDDLLTEFEQNSDRITVTRLNPEPQSDAADMALFDGVEPIITIGSQKLYMGLSISCLDKLKNLSELVPQEESLLEYRITRAIVQVYRGDKPVVGVLSSLPVLGLSLTPEMAQRKQQPVPAWLAFQELQEDFELIKVYAQASELPKSLDTLILIHPPKLSEQMTVAIDQFILKGGNALIFVDPYSIIASGLLKQQPDVARISISSDLELLFKAWGVGYNPNEAVADSTLARRVTEKNIQQSLPTLIDLQTGQINTENVVTGKLNHIAMVFSGSFDIDKVDTALKAEVLLSTTEESQKIPSSEAVNPQKVLAEFKKDGTKKNMALTLSGNFPPVYETNRKLKTKPSTVMIIGDSDMLYDQVCVQFQNVGGKKLKKMLNDNINLLQNSVEYLTGAKQLIGIRSRETKQRPFVVMHEMQAKADLEFKEQIMEMKNELDASRDEFRELAGATSDKKVITTKEQKEALNKVRHTEAIINREVKAATKELYRDVEILKTKIKWICIAMMPFLIALVGLIAALIKNGRCGAK